jgi:hypothetical protein
MLENMQIGPKVGLHWPIGDYGDVADLGYTIGGQLKAPVNERWSWGVHFAYATADGSDTAGGLLQVANIDYDVTMFEIYPFVDYYIARGYRIQDGQMDFFLRGGLGLNFWDVDFTVLGTETPVMSSEDDMDLMIAVGAGVNLFRNFEAVLLYNRIVTADFDGPYDANEYITITIGYNFNLAVN